MKTIATIIMLLVAARGFGQAAGPLAVRGSEKPSAEGEPMAMETDSERDAPKHIGAWETFPSEDVMTDERILAVTNTGTLLQGAKHNQNPRLYGVCQDSSPDHPKIGLNYLSPDDRELHSGWASFSGQIRFDKRDVRRYTCGKNSGGNLVFLGSRSHRERMAILRHMENSERMLVRVDQYKGRTSTSGMFPISAKHTLGLRPSALPRFDRW